MTNSSTCCSINAILLPFGLQSTVLVLGAGVLSASTHTVAASCCAKLRCSELHGMPHSAMVHVRRLVYLRRRRGRLSWWICSGMARTKIKVRRVRATLCDASSQLFRRAETATHATSADHRENNRVLRFCFNPTQARAAQPNI